MPHGVGADTWDGYFGSFGDLKPCYVIFICTIDPFADGKYCYTFENRCIENGKSLGDQVTKIFLNTRGKDSDGVSQVLIHFLHYVEESTDSYANETKDETIIKIHDKISRMKADGIENPVERLLADEAYRKEMLDKYNLTL